MWLLEYLTCAAPPSGSGRVPDRGDPGKASGQGQLCPVHQRDGRSRRISAADGLHCLHSGTGNNTHDSSCYGVVPEAAQHVGRATQKTLTEANQNNFIYIFMFCNANDVHPLWTSQTPRPHSRNLQVIMFRCYQLHLVDSLNHYITGP